MDTLIPEKITETTTEIVSIEKHIERIKDLLDKETDKKLQVVRLYLLMHHDVSASIGSVEDLASYLRTNSVETDLLIGIFDVLEQTFSRGYPNFVYEYELNNGITLTNLKDNIETCLPFEEEKSYNDSFVYVKRAGEVVVIDNTLLKVPVIYEKYKEEMEFSGTKARGELESKTTFDVVFDSVTNLCYIQCGERNQSHATHKVFLQNIIRTFKIFSSFSFSSKKKKTQVEGEYQLDKQTIILLDYIENSINQEGHEINDYLSVAFANKNQQKKVRSVRLSGNNLLDSYEVGDRVRLGDLIKSVRFQLRFKTGENTIEMVNVTIDFQATIKFQYSNLNNTLNICDINRHLIKTLNNSLNKTYSEQQVDANIKEIIARAKVRDSAFLISVLGKVKDDINQMTLSKTEKTKVLDVINSYLIEG
ncbi:hypothetical protein [Jeotgalibacillus sp. R-1-5s-1]|uniref:hypothetical protein n=1 Tax=Jeotgalibacillus sp. R-1-5s-1 TaxID=2555897 RepID=UPI00106D614A|nr:hypothetical protein [Jeotgalibacillus sp. R-1-5s-1]TFD94314.1 hypothetical protein E2491_12770 [Jeotgalibacillus sp. R-1-5s-1]